MKRLLLCFMMIFSFAFLVQAVPVNAAEDQEVTIYDVRSDYADKVFMPAELPKEYQIPDHVAGTKYKVMSGAGSVEVSTSGLVTVKRNYWKKDTKSGIIMPSDEKDYDYYTITPGDAEIRITYNKKVTKSLTVHLVNYADVYRDKEIQKYIDSNITPDMSDDELAAAIAKFPAGYDYLDKYSKLSDMVVNGAGNAKACADAVVTLAEKLGYEAWIQYTDKTVNKRMIAMVKIHDKYYQIDAGKQGEKDEDGYRPYDVVSRTSLFRYEVMDDENANITSYDGIESTGVLEVPSSIDGYKVAQIGWKGLAELDCTKIVLPDTLETLDYYAFSACKNLKEIELPASLNTIMGVPFEGCSSLETLTVAEESNTFMAEDNVVYSKDGKTLITAAMVSEFKVPDTVTTIAEYAFGKNTNLRKIEIPDSVQTIGSQAFSECSGLIDVQLSEGLKVIGQKCFESDTNLTVIRFPSTVTNIEAYAFYGCSGLKAAVFCGDAPKFGTVIYGNQLLDNVFYRCNLTGYYPTGNNTWDDSVLTGYYSKHGASYIAWAEWDPDNVQSVADAEVTLSQDSYVYTGQKCKPDVTVTVNGLTLAPVAEYIVGYTENVNAGTAQVYIMGCGRYEGVKSVPFQIKKAPTTLPKGTVLALLDKTELDVGESISFRNVALPGCEFSSDAPEIVSVSTAGAITAAAPGTAKVSVTYPGDDNHLPIGVIYTITVKEAATPTPSVEPSNDPGSDNTPIPSESTEPSLSPEPNVPSKAPVQSPDASVPSKAPVQSPAANVPSKAPVQSPDASVPTNKPGNDDPKVTPGQKPSTPGNTTTAKPNPTKAPGQSTAKPKTTKAPAATKAPSKTSSKADTGKTNTTAKGKTVVYKKAKYRITGAATVEFTQLVKGKTVTIPDTITVGGKVYKVTSIAAGACRDNKKITKLTIGKNVKKIGKEAFMNCKKLKKIVCKSTLFKAGSIKKNAFKEISSKVVLKTPKGKETMYKKWFAL